MAVLSELGAGFIAFILVASLWETVWKLIALWKAARKGSLAWFIVLAILNTVGILPILYIFVFSKMGKKQSSKPAIKQTMKPAMKKPAMKPMKK